jgi:hypothetical protein
MAATKTVLTFMLVGAFLGAVAASFIVPPMLSWYNEPGSITPGKDVQTLCNLPELIRYASNRLLLGQLVGGGLGALIAVFPGVSLVRRRSRLAPPAVPAPVS